MRIAAMAGAVGIEMALSVVAGLWLGKWVDGKWAISPWGLYVGLGLGSVAGFRALYRFARHARSARSDDSSTGGVLR